jgi:hypothetical protein
MRREDDQPELDDQDRALLDQLRALPDVGAEPDWNALERAIRSAVGPDVPKPWWRRWRWLAPVSELAATAAGALLWLHHPQSSPPAAPTAEQVPAHVTPAPEPATAAETPEMAMWLGGKIVDLDEVDPAAIDDDDLDREARAALATDEGGGPNGGILPATDFGWIDSLDDSALDRAETFLERKKG